MLYHFKEVSIVRVRDYVPEGMTLEEHLDDIEKQKPSITISYDQDNAYDKEAKYATLPDGAIIGYLNADSHRYLKACMAESEENTCKAQFVEVVRREGHTPFIIYKVLVNLEDVERLKAGDEWNQWDTNYPVASNLGNSNTVNRLASSLKRDLTTGVDNPQYPSLIEKLEKATLYDMSVETTIVYDDLCFLLESSCMTDMRPLKDMLQHASTVRRTDRMRKAFVDKWWPEVLESGPCNKMWIDYLQKLCVNKKIKSDGKISQKVIKDELGLIEADLERLPYNLYASVDNMADLFSGMYYTKIPREKQKKLLSLMVLRHKLNAIKNKRSIQISNMFVCGQNVFEFQKGAQTTIYTGKK